jgi:hypothetical protein
MHRTLVPISLFAALMVSNRLDAGEIVAQLELRLPAEFELILSPTEPINNGANFFTQTGTAVAFGGLNLIMTTYPWTLPADVETDVGPTFSGNPFGVYETFDRQYQSFLGTTGDEFQPSGLVALLAQGVGVNETFNEVFGDQFSETEVIDALVRLRLGDTSGFPMLHSMMSGSLAQQPTYFTTDIGSFELGPAQLVRFSTGTLVGEVISGSYQITRSPAVVPEPGSLLSAMIGIATTLGVSWRRRRTARLTV